MDEFLTNDTKIAKFEQQLFSDERSNEMADIFQKAMRSMFIQFKELDENCVSKTQKFNPFYKV